MSYINATMPRRIAAGFKIGPRWKTDITVMDNGREQRNRGWLYPRWEGSGNLGAFSPEDRQALIAMFVVAGGRWSAFRVFDPTDHYVSNEPVAPDFGTSMPLQLMRGYTFPGSGVSVPVLVQAPIGSTVVVKRNGTPVAGTLDDTLGLFTPAAPWEHGLYTWTGQYERWMRFDSDWGAFTANAMNAYTADIDLIEVRR
jgi:uncharacterized protein (TIGR02217 family)